MTDAPTCSCPAHKNTELVDRWLRAEMRVFQERMFLAWCAHKEIQGPKGGFASRYFQRVYDALCDAPYSGPPKPEA